MLGLFPLSAAPLSSLEIGGLGGRPLGDGLAAEVCADVLAPVVFVRLEFDSGALRLWSGFGDFAWDGQTWTGTGALGSVSPAEETTGIKATNASFSLNGIPSSILSLAYAEEYQLRPAYSWLGAVDDAGTLIGTPYRWFKGRMDTMQDEDTGETCTLTLSAENHLADLERPRERRYTPEDQALDYPGDKGLDFVAQLQDAEITWGTN